MENIFCELKNAKVNHLLYGEGIISNLELKEYERNFDVICSIKFESDSKDYRIFKLIASELERKLTVVNRNIKKYIDYLNELNIKKEKDYKKTKRQEILRNREVEKLLHFTNMGNLLSIMENGLLSVNQLVNKNISYFGSDKDRFDNKLDYICTSISFPNYKMFYSKRIENKNDTWIILKINLQIIIDKDDSLFLPTNSADKIIQGELAKNKDYYTTNQALEDLFKFKVNYRGEVKYRQDSLINRNMTTNPQAEILICDTIDIKYIDSVIVENEQEQKKVQNILDNKSILIEVDSELFGYREDFENWRNEYDCAPYIY